ncbi:uncharacterized protein TrAtP1_005691 [Trichoderma atroviride]|uniref:uncharacterized protein n=1 Tax=Hypocrea atroviridis TaxID=63577 RepID=UPI0033181304|nr:hypothetical protein TrAtP1_005691 [Trichoderma atroviride]
MRYLCCCHGSSESIFAPRYSPNSALQVVPDEEPQGVPTDESQVITNDAPQFISDDESQIIPNDAPQVIPRDEPHFISDDAPTLRICFAAMAQGIRGSRWKCREYQIRFQNLVTWRHIFDHLDTPSVPDSDSLGQGDESSSYNNTELYMTTAAYGEEEAFEVECDGKIGDSRAAKSESRWSLSTTLSTLSLETVRASAKSHSKKKTSTKTSLPSDSVQKMRLKSKQTDSSKHSQQPPTYTRSQQQHASYNSADGAEEEKRRRHQDALEQLEANSFQPQLGTLKHQAWSKLRMLIANGLDEEAREYFPKVVEGQEALLLPIAQKRNSFKVNMQNMRASDIEDAKAALTQIEYWKWRNVVILVRDGDTPLEQTEWRIMEKPLVLDWTSSFI